MTTGGSINKNDQSEGKAGGKKRKSLREETERAFLWMVLFGLIVIGGGLIALIYGLGALLTALPFLLGGGLLIGLLFLLFKGIDYILDRYDR